MPRSCKKGQNEGENTLKRLCSQKGAKPTFTSKSANIPSHKLNDFKISKSVPHGSLKNQ